MTIKDLKPAEVWNNFYLLTRQPRPSKHEEKVRAFLLDWAKENKIEAFADDTGNVIMRVPATKGYENRKGVVLQGHMDMVPQKNSDIKHDFENDPIETKIEGDWIKACGTTLGADNGLGVAMAMAVAQSKTIEHGPVEVLVTYDEETGMTGAQALKSGVLKGDILMNLDSETEGEFYVGCAGGLDMTCEGKYTRKDEPAGYECWALNVLGCQGGHSGMDINLYRANANKIAARLLYVLLTNADAKLLDMEGGTLRNAIPRECFCTVYLKDPKAAQAALDKEIKAIKDEYKETDPDMNIVFKPYECTEPCDQQDCKYVDEKEALNIIRAILNCPDGVERMSASVSGLVETSNNMAMVKIYRGEYFVKSLLRSSVDSAKEALEAKMRAEFELIGADVISSGGYSGWAPNPKSEILSVMKDVYKAQFNQEPKVMAIHAGLECGILSGAYPNWDMVSMGPTLLSPHSPDERAYIPSVAKVWDFLQAVLKNIPCK